MNTTSNPISNDTSFDAEAEVLSRTFKVIVADDDPDARTLLDIALSGSNLEIAFYENGEQAINACKTELPDFAILDVQMPGKSGIEVCKEIKEKSDQVFIPVILLTAQSALSDRVYGLNCGADDYITKPFNVTELEARVKALLRIKVLTDQLRKTQNELAQKEKELIAMHVAGAAAHELGQPLTTVMLSLQFLQRLDKDDPKYASTLNSVFEQCTRMKTILQKLHEVQEYKTKKYPGNLQILDI